MLLTVILMTQATSSVVFVINTNRTSTPAAAMSSSTLRNSWITRLALIHHLVVSLMGFQLKDLCVGAT